MKKSEIIKLIESNLTIIKNSELLSKYKVNSRYEIYQSETQWYPDVPQFNKYFSILKKELLKAQSNSLLANKNICGSKCCCQHEVRLCYHNIFFSSNKCVLCGEEISSDNCLNFKESKYRNKHTVTFDSKYQEDEDSGTYELKNGKTMEEVLLLIYDLIKNYKDDDEIDLVEVFNNAKIHNAKINMEQRRKEKYILIIGGTNREYIDSNEEMFITKFSHIDGNYFFDYFKDLLNTKVAFIDNKDHFNETIYNNTCIKSYTNIESLEYILQSFKDINFDFIIDLTDLTKYTLINNQVIPSEYKLDIKKYFPNSHIISIHSIDKQKDMDEIRTILKSYKENILNRDNDFYYLDNDSLVTKNIDETCQHIKRLIKK